MYISLTSSVFLSRGRYVILYPKNSPKIVSAGGGFQEMYIEVADVLWAIVATGFPVGTVTWADHYHK